MIVTAEYVPDIGESGTARTFIIEMQPNSLDLSLLTEVQALAAEGLLQRCMFAYIEWLKYTYLENQDTVAEFAHSLKNVYSTIRTSFREELQQSKIVFHDRLPDTLASLHIGFQMMLLFLEKMALMSAETSQAYLSEFGNILMMLAAKQSEAVVTDKPTHIFIQKLFAMVECGQATILKKDAPDTIHPSNLLGYENEEYYFIFFEASHKAVARFCAEQNEVFTITPKALSKQLAEEDLILLTESGKGTRSLPFNGVNKRVMLLRKDAVKEICEGI